MYKKRSKKTNVSISTPLIYKREDKLIHNQVIIIMVFRPEPFKEPVKGEVQGF